MFVSRALPFSESMALMAIAAALMCKGATSDAAGLHSAPDAYLSHAMTAHAVHEAAPLQRRADDPTYTTKIIFVRHGDTDFTDERRIQGPLDVVLTEKGPMELVLNAKGLEHAHTMARKLSHEDIDLVCCSSLKRAMQTLEAIMAERKPNSALSSPSFSVSVAGASSVPAQASKDESKHLPPVVFDNRLNGQNMGELTGKSYDLVDWYRPESAEKYRGVEPRATFTARLEEFLADIVGAQAERAAASERRGGYHSTILIVGHGATFIPMIRRLRLAAGEDARTIDNDLPPYFSIGTVPEVTIARLNKVPLQGGSRLDWTAAERMPLPVTVWYKQLHLDRR